MAFLAVEDDAAHLFSNSALLCPMANATLPPLVRCPLEVKLPRSVATLSPMTRVGLIAIGLSLAGLLATARCLVPHPAGFGTHEQLGLEPCLMLRLWQTPCPSCGMTTAWSHVVRGDFGSAARANLGGVATCVLAIAAMPWLLASGFRGRWCLWRPTEMALIVLAGSMAAITLLDFLIRIRLVVWP